jgi:hypothetical protein
MSGFDWCASGRRQDRQQGRLNEHNSFHPLREAAGEHEGGHAAAGMSEKVRPIKPFGIKDSAEIVHSTRASAVIGRHEAVAAIMTTRAYQKEAMMVRKLCALT